MDINNINNTNSINNENDINNENNSSFDMQRYVASLSFLQAGNYGTDEAKQKLAKDFAKAQGEMPSVKKDKKGDKGKYATLDNILEEVEKIFTKNNISISQNVYDDGKYIGVQTILTHSEGAEKRSAITIREYEKILASKFENKVQNVGAMMTYYKRYSLSSLIGISLDSDDDGAFGGYQNNNYQKNNYQNNNYQNNNYQNNNTVKTEQQPKAQQENHTPSYITKDQQEDLTVILKAMGTTWEGFRNKNTNMFKPHMMIGELGYSQAEKLISGLKAQIKKIKDEAKSKEKEEK